MTTRPIFLVLEDHEARVDFLRETFGKHVDIVWAVAVRSFLRELKEVPKSRIAAVIWDHDLGVVGSNKDVDGLQGIDAARTADVPLHVYQLIWSINPDGAKNIALALGDRGFTNIERIEAKTSNRPQLAAQLTLAILQWRKGLQ